MENYKDGVMYDLKFKAFHKWNKFSPAMVYLDVSDKIQFSLFRFVISIAYCTSMYFEPIINLDKKIQTLYPDILKDDHRYIDGKFTIKFFLFTMA